MCEKGILFANLVTYYATLKNRLALQHVLIKMYHDIFTVALEHCDSAYTILI